MSKVNSQLKSYFHIIRINPTFVKKALFQSAESTKQTDYSMD